MRIALVEFAGKGGLIHYDYQLLKALARQGAEATLVTDGRYELESLPHDFRVVKLLRLWDPKPEGAVSVSAVARAGRNLRRVYRAAVHYREWLRLLLWLRRERPEVAVFSDIRFPADLVCFALLRLLGIRTADICHNVRPFSPGAGDRVVATGALTRRALDRIYRTFDVVFVHFDANRAEFLRTFSVPPERVVRIEHGNQALLRSLADPAKTPETFRREAGLAPDDRVVLLFGTLTGYKGADVALEAFPAVLAAEPRARLVFAGYPARDFDAAGMRRRARELRVGDEVRILPRYLAPGEIAGLIGAAEVAIFPYRAIFQSGAVPAAMEFGTPVVATRVGAIPEVIEDGRSGLLVPPADPGALATAVLRVLGDEGLARRLSEEGRRDAMTRFSWDAVARTVLAAVSRTGRGPGNGARS